MTITTKPGITLLVNGQDVPLKLESQIGGAEFDLVRPVALGTPDELAVFIAETFGVTDADDKINGAIGSLPEPLKGMADRLMNLEITVEEFHVKVPEAEGSTSYKVGLSGTWPGNPIELIADVLEVKGVYLLVENDGLGDATVDVTPEPQPQPPPAPVG